VNHVEGAADATAHTLLNCLVREVSDPEGQASLAGEHLVVRLPRRDLLLRARIRRASLIGAHRFAGPVEERCNGRWTRIGWERLARCMQAELELRSGVTNGEFLTQVASSHDTVRQVLAHRAQAAAPADPYLDSEQSLVFGHRFHPTPKARTGQDWLRYAPEARATFRLHHLAVHRSVLREECADARFADLFDRLGAELRTGATPAQEYAVLPVHPWQLQLLSEDDTVGTALRAALADGRLVDLGAGGPPVVPTASVRTLYHPPADVFCKFSLNVRITNCVRKNADYELRGAVALTRLLRPVASELRDRFPGTVLLAEPAYRTVDVDGARGLAEGLGVIVREGLGGHLLPGVTPLLAGALADEYASSGAQAGRVLAAHGLDAPEATLAWWDAYVGLLVPPVLHAYFHRGVVLEPHLQNVVVGLGEDGMPVQLFLRDMEGTKLLPSRHADALAELPAGVREQVTYDVQRGWNRVVYCLLVNHVAELLAALADRHPRLERRLWDLVHDQLDAYRAAHGGSPQLRALLSGVPLPAKTNLLTRWERKADRYATYVPVPNPLPNPLARPAVRAAREAAL
jgi:siderophore synthetase component